MQTKTRQRSQKKTSVPLADRAALTPDEFASRFGKHKLWAYRLVYGGKLKSIREFGRCMIPQSEVDRILSTAK